MRYLILTMFFIVNSWGSDISKCDYVGDLTYFSGLGSTLKPLTEKESNPVIGLKITHIRDIIGRDCMYNKGEMVFLQVKKTFKSEMGKQVRFIHKHVSYAIEGESKSSDTWTLK